MGSFMMQKMFKGKDSMCIKGAFEKVRQTCCNCETEAAVKKNCTCLSPPTPNRKLEIRKQIKQCHVDNLYLHGISIITLLIIEKMHFNKSRTSLEPEQKKKKKQPTRSQTEYRKLSLASPLPFTLVNRDQGIIRDLSLEVTN